MAFSALEALQAFGAGRQMQMQERQMARQEALASRQEQGRVRVGEQVRAGDFVGAAGTAFESGLGDDVMQSVQRMNQAQQGQLMREAGAGMSAAQALRQAPMEQRAALAAQFAPQLRQVGFDDNEIQQLSADLSDGALDGHISFTQGILNRLGPQSRGGQEPSRIREINYWRANGRDDLANALEARLTTRAVPIQNADGTYTIHQVPITGGGQQGAQGMAPDLPDELSDDDIDALGGPEQPAPATFSADQWQPVDGSSYPPGQW